MKSALKSLTLVGRYGVVAAPGGQDARLVAELARTGQDVLFVARDDVAAAAMSDALEFFAPDLNCLEFPAWDCLPYDRVSPKTSIISARIEALTCLLAKKTKARIVVTTVSAFLQRVPPKEAFKTGAFTISVGDEFEPGVIEAYLVEHGYHSAQTVMEPGEFAKRGGLIDIFPTGASAPVRLDFFGDEVESLRSFDAASQRTTGEVTSLALKPVSEAPLDEDAISRFRTGYRALFGAVTKSDPLYESISEGRRFIGMEHWLALFYDGRLDTLLDYVPGATVLFDHQADQAIEARLDLINEYYMARKTIMDGRKGPQTTENPYNAVPPERLYIKATEVAHMVQGFAVGDLSPFDAPQSDTTLNIGAKSGRDFSDARIDPNVNVFDVLEHHLGQVTKDGKRALIGAYTVGTRERLMAVMADHNLKSQVVVDNWAEVSALKKGQVGVAVLGLERGFVTDDLVVISEQDILGERLTRPGKRKISAKNFIADVSSLSEGDMVVHVEHGIAKYEGLITLDIGGAKHDCLKLVYSGGDKLFLPVENIDVITRYGSEDASARLDKLGGAAWQARRAGLKDRLKDMAEELIKLAASREL
ncbi:MAG: transcription-repair coupling factor, partial [Magnetovibrio sp.]|nr:transcription-repair coupling factor [Magnetovibrio sp.]